jgi:hypothetical protein
MDISPHFKKTHKKPKQIFKNYQDKVHIHTLNGLTSKVNISMHLSKQFTMFYNIDHKDNINQTNEGQRLSTSTEYIHQICS